MSEEVRNASASIPKAMLAIYICNFILMFPAFLTVCYHVPNIDDALSDSTTYPAIYVLRQSMSTGWVTIMLVVICLLNIASNIVYLTAVSRDLFAFARDKGLPFSRWLSTIHPKRKIPQNAATLSCGFAVCLALVYIGSMLGVSDHLSLSTADLLSHQVPWLSSPSTLSSRWPFCNVIASLLAVSFGVGFTIPKRCHLQTSRLVGGVYLSTLWQLSMPSGPSSGASGPSLLPSPLLASTGQVRFSFRFCWLR
jgi:amino acid permease